MTSLELLRLELARSSELWQMQLQSCNGLAAHASEYGLDGFNADSVRALWLLGLIRAELVTSATAIDNPPLTLVGDDADGFKYFDGRVPAPRAEGLGNSLVTSPELDRSTEVLFHPFRVLVLFHIDRIFRLSSSAAQYLYFPDGLRRIADQHVQSLDSWTRTDSPANRFDYWNRVAELAIVLEPGVFRQVFGFTRIPGREEEVKFVARLDEHQVKSRGLITELGQIELDKMREELCYEAHKMDGNDDLHVILRFMHGRERLRLKGRLGASMAFLGMSEIMRRAAEPILGPLREEDELRPGQWMPGARQMLYGTERVADATDLQRRQYMAFKGLDHATKVRCYVEGETEFAALEHALAGLSGVELINLRGQVIERGGRGVAFVQSLERDLANHVFSVILLDSDRLDYIRAVRKAAEEDRFFGRFFLSSPDVEFGNFSRDELIEVLIRLIGTVEKTPVLRDQLEVAVATAESGKAFLSAVGRLGISHPGKGNHWGRELMRFAIEHNMIPPGHPHAGERRPILLAADLAIQGTRANFRFSFESYRIDPTTGELVPRLKASSS